MYEVMTESNVNNGFLSRREIICSFADASGRLRKLEATEMVIRALGLEGKLVIPIRLENKVGRTSVRGTFYVYDDENAAKAHIDPGTVARFEKAKNTATGTDLTGGSK